MDRPKLKVADVLRRYGEAYREQHAASLSPTQRRVMSAIERCRTAALGSHREHCDRWINAPTNALVTTRAEIGIAQSASAWRALSGSRIVKLNSSIPNTSTSSSPCRKRLPPSPTKTKNWGTAFCSGLPPKTLRTIAADPKHLGAEIGFFAVLHSWRQNLFFHPHLHCVVPGGGISPRRRSLGLLPLGLLPARARALAPVPPLISGVLQKAFDHQQLHFFSSLHRSINFRTPLPSRLILLPSGRQSRSSMEPARSYPCGPTAYARSSTPHPCQTSDEHFRNWLWHLGQIYSLNSVP
jgi:hypothetical protein